MEADEGFMKRLRAGQIITPSDADYASWQRQRNEYDRLQSRSIVERFGFKPAAPTLSGLIGHMFLHGSFDHLLGNMAILFIVGYLVEETLGKRRYLLFYLISGIGAAGFDWLFNGDRLAFVKTYHLKGAARQQELPLAEVPALAAPAEADNGDFT